MVVSVDDQHGGVVARSFAWEVVGNTDPVIDPIADQTSDEGDTVSLAVTASDDDGDTLVFAATGLPDGFDINATTGQIFGDITQTAATGSPFTVEVTADDQKGGIATTTFTWTVDVVNLDPVVDPDRRSDRTGGRRRHWCRSRPPIGRRLVALRCVGSARRAGHRCRRQGRSRGTIAAGAAAGSPYAVEVTVDDQAGAHGDDRVHLDGRVEPIACVGRVGGVVRVW